MKNYLFVPKYWRNNEEIIEEEYHTMKKEKQEGCINKKET